MDNIYIQKATNEHIEYISNNVESKFTCSWTKEQFASIVKVGNTHCFVATCNDTILGFICFKKIVDEIDILNIAVDIDFRGKGILYINHLKLVLHFYHLCTLYLLQKIKTSPL